MVEKREVEIFWSVLFIVTQEGCRRTLCEIGVLQYTCKVMEEKTSKLRLKLNNICLMLVLSKMSHLKFRITD